MPLLRIAIAKNARKSEYTYITEGSYLLYTSHLRYMALIDWYMVMFIDCSYLESVMHRLKSFPWSWLRSIHVREGKTYFHIWWLNFKQSLERRDFYIHAQCIYLKCVSMHKTIFMKSVFTLGYLYDASAYCFCQIGRCQIVASVKVKNQRSIQ